MEMFCDVLHYGMGLMLPFFQHTYEDHCPFLCTGASFEAELVPTKFAKNFCANAKKYVKLAHCIPFAFGGCFHFYFPHSLSLNTLASVTNVSESQFH